MKKTTILTTLLALAAATATADPRPSRSSAMRDVATHDDLSRKLRMSQQADPIRDLGPAKGNVDEDPAKQLAGRDLIASSTILSFGGNLTLVPKRAILHVPERLQGRLAITPGSKVLSFQDFQKKNRGWIRTIEVTREQALGHVPFDESIAESISSSSSVVVATFKAGPISVLPLKDPEEVPTALESKPVVYRK